MKNQKLFFLQILLVLISGLSDAQPTSSLHPITPNGMFDHVSDQYGHEYPLINISLTAARPFSSGTYSTSNVPTNSCSAGYFNLFFAPNSLFDLNSSAANVVCEVYRNISGLINSSLSYAPGIGQKINIYCDNIPPATPSSVLGLGGLLYIYPYNPLNPNPGILDNQIQRALITGQNPYANLPISVFGGSNNFYMGYMYVNPSPTSGTWNYNLTTTSIGTGYYDLYTILLHEAMHTLGFASLISSTGTSIIGTSNNYFSRYDQYLTNSSGASLIASSSTACSTSSITFQGPTSAINPSACAGGNSDLTNCSISAKYISPNVNVKVYTPDCFENGSSLSHFEDMCSYGSFTTSCVPTPTAPGYNNLYFVMSNNANTGNCYVKRHLTEEERYVLCDLGYSVNTTYTSNAAGASYTYSGSGCSGLNLWGMHDGISGNAFTYTTNGTTFSIPTSSLLLNDSPTATQISCLEVIYNSATPSISSGSLNVTALAGAGLVVLKYLPKNAANQLGSATYIYVYFISSNCSPNSCNMVQNGGFENTNPINYPCGIIEPNISTDAILDCWVRRIGTPDLYTRYCAAASPACDLGINTWGSTPPVDSHNGSPNNAAIGLGGAGNGSEVIKNNLNAPLIPGQSYQVSIWLFNPPSVVYSNSSSPVVVSIAVDPSVTSIVNAGWFPSGSTSIADFTINQGVWTQFTSTFVFTPTTYSVNHYALLLGQNQLKSNAVAIGNPATNNTYVFFDDVSLTPLSSPSPAFSIPQAANCGNTSLTNLAQYANYPGTFSGTGVTSSTSGTLTTYNFNSALTLTPGTYPIAFTYTDSNSSCVYEISQNVILGSPNFTVTTSTSGTPVYCTNYSPPQAPITLSASCTQTSGITYVWQPGNISGATATVIPLASQAYSVFALGNCLTTTTLAVQISSTCCTSTNTPIGSISAIDNIKTGPLLINGNITVQGGQSLFLTGGEFLFGPNVQITVNNGGSMYIDNSHLYACADMWKGIKIMDGGRILLSSQTPTVDNLIEDAITAIDISGHATSTLTSILQATKTTFNKNYVAINISGYVRNASGYPFSIENCVFTSRSFSFTSTSWPQSTTLRTTSTVSGLATPYLLNSVSIGNLKAPYSSQSSQTAIKLLNVGSTVFNTVYAINIGNPSSSSSFNLFDAMGNGISADDCNLNSYNNTFQNTRVIGGVPGIGIRAANSYTNTSMFDNWLSLTPTTSASSNINRFYDCHIAVSTKNLAWLTIGYANIQSTQSSTNTPSATDLGLYGISLASNRFNTYTITNNNFLNLSTAIYGAVTSGIINSTTTPATYGQVWGTFNINNNLFSPSTTTVVGNNFINNAIVIEQLLYSKGPSAAGSFVALSPLNGLHIQFNNFNKVWRGVMIRNFTSSLYGKTTANNTITIIPDVNSSNPQWGVRHEFNTSGIINTNTISSTTTSTTIPIQGIYTSMCTINGVQCNSLVSLPVGTQFSGLNSGMVWRNNAMNTNTHGLQLANTGIIGQQGTFGAPEDNVWEGTWSGSNFNTFTADATTTATSSVLWTRTTSGYAPGNNSGNPNLQSYLASGALQNASNTAPRPNCIPTAPSGGLPWYSDLPRLTKNIATRQIHYVDYRDITTEINDILLYRELRQDSALQVDNDTLHDFYTYNQTSSIGILTDVEEQLSEGDFSGAGSTLSGFTPGTNIEQNYNDFYVLYINFMDAGYLGSSDKSSLAALANKCPFIDGPVVYSARAFYNLVTSSVILYADDDCEARGTSALRISSPTSKKSNAQTISYRLFPNPAVDELQIFGSVENENVTISICDVNNRQLLNQSLNISSYHSSLKLNLLNGVYFVTLVNQNNERLVKKLVIAK